jgi:hypothetical protein
VPKTEATRPSDPLGGPSLTYFEFSANDGWFRKYEGRAGDSVQLPATYSVGTAYTIKITVGQMVATIERSARGPAWTKTTC